MIHMPLIIAATISTVRASVPLPRKVGMATSVETKLVEWVGEGGDEVGGDNGAASDALEAATCEINSQRAERAAELRRRPRTEQHTALRLLTARARDEARV